MSGGSRAAVLRPRPRSPRHRPRRSSQLPRNARPRELACEPPEGDPPTPEPGVRGIAQPSSEPTGAFRCTRPSIVDQCRELARPAVQDRRERDPGTLVPAQGARRKRTRQRKHATLRCTKDAAARVRARGEPTAAHARALATAPEAASPPPAALARAANARVEALARASLRPHERAVLARGRSRAAFWRLRTTRWTARGGTSLSLAAGEPASIADDRLPVLVLLAQRVGEPRVGRRAARLEPRDLGLGAARSAAARRPRRSARRSSASRPRARRPPPLVQCVARRRESSPCSRRASPSRDERAHARATASRSTAASSQRRASRGTRTSRRAVAARPRSPPPPRRAARSTAPASAAARSRAPRMSRRVVVRGLVGSSVSPSATAAAIALRAGTGAARQRRRDELAAVVDGLAALHGRGSGLESVEIGDDGRGGRRAAAGVGSGAWPGGTRATSRRGGCRRRAALRAPLAATSRLRASVAVWISACCRSSG